MKGYMFLPLFLLLLNLRDALGQNRGQVRIVDNGYRDVLLAISEDVPENPELITKIQKVFTDTSRTLYQATKDRAYLHDVTLLIPKSWKNTPALPAAREGFDKSDIVVDVSNKQYGQGDRPFTLKTTGCGENGHYIRLTEKYLLDDKEADKYGPYEKVLTHEWAHYRFGVFDEYQGDRSDKDHFYAGRGGKTQATRCSGQLTGRMYNRNNGADGCKYVGQMPEPGCRFRDDVMQGKYASIMYKTRLAHLVEFCDEDDDAKNVRNIHNSEAPSRQNRQCGGRSIWEVLREHPDFKSVNGPQPGLDTTPEFRIVRQEDKKVVLVLDNSGSMGRNNRLQRLGHGCSNYIWNVMRDGEHLGIVWFSRWAEIKIGVTEVNEATRPLLVANIPTVTGGGTSIGAGIRDGLAALKDAGGTIGGTLIVVSDGEENTDPRIADVFDEVVDAGVTVHTIAFTDSADSSMDALALRTGGLSFLYSDSDTSNALNEAFRQIGELNMDVFCSGNPDPDFLVDPMDLTFHYHGTYLENPNDRKYNLFSKAEVLDGVDQTSGSVTLDSSLGRETEFVIDYSRDTTRVTLTSPSGERFDETHPICKHDKTFKAYTFSVPKRAEAGEWRFQVANENWQEQRIAMTVSAKSAVRGEAPIVSRASWGRRNLGLDGSASAKQAIYVMVSKGYAPVVNADVKATVDRPGESPVELVLKDTGAGADVVEDDGVYSAYFLDFTDDGRYNVKVAVNGNPTTVVSPQRIIGRGAPGVDLTDLSAYADEPTGSFQRSESGGSFQLKDYIEGQSYYLPGAITDLDIDDASRSARTVSLRWTATGSHLDAGQATRYELRMADNIAALQRNFSKQIMVTDDMLTNGAKLTEPKPAGDKEAFTLKIDTIGEVTFAFAVRAVHLRGGRDVTGPLSNAVGVSMADFPQLSSGGLGPGAIAGIVVACVALVALAMTTVLLVMKKKRMVTQVAPEPQKQASQKGIQPQKKLASSKPKPGKATKK